MTPSENTNFATHPRKSKKNGSIVLSYRPSVNSIPIHGENKKSWKKK